MYLVERYWPGVTTVALGDAIARIREASEREAGGHGAVRHVGSTLVAAEETVFCLFEATSMEAVADVNARAHVATDRITPCVWFPAPVIPSTAVCA
ncbi:MAG: nickel-binding protein [Acidimicrobiales bacterium]